MGHHRIKLATPPIRPTLQTQQVQTIQQLHPQTGHLSQDLMGLHKQDQMTHLEILLQALTLPTQPRQTKRITHQTQILTGAILL
jgi:hypothetical protein